MRIYFRCSIEYVIFYDKKVCSIYIGFPKYQAILCCIIVHYYNNHFLKKAKTCPCTTKKDKRLYKIKNYTAISLKK